MNNLRSYVLALVTLGLLFRAPARAQQPVPGTFTTIDFPGAADTVECCSAILNINPEGQIVGGYLDTSGTGHGFLLSHGNFTTVDFPQAIYTEALGINPEGQIVGTYVDASFNVHGFLLNQGNFSAISFPNSPMTFINWINPEGDMVGGYMGNDGTFHGLLVSRGTFNTIDFPGAGATFALGINSSGEIVGAYVDQAGLNLHGFLLSMGRFTSFDFPGAVTNLSACGGFGGGVAYTDGINNEGAIVGGYCGADGKLHGFLLSQGSALTIDFPGALYTFAGGIDPQGEIVGGYQSTDGHYHGFLLSNGGAGSQNALTAPQGGSPEGQRAVLPENIRKALRRMRAQ